MTRDEFMLRLRAVWDMYPNLRFGQMLDNALDDDIDYLFWIKDKELIEELECQITSN